LLSVTYRLVDRVGMAHVIEFMTQQLSPFDTRELDWLKLLPLNKSTLLHGECTFPGETQERGETYGYRIRASVNVLMRPPFTYQHWGRIPSKKNAQGWVSGEQTFRFRDLEECAVHTLSHECFHFLSNSKQIDLKDSEANANWWGDQWLEAYRTLVDAGGQIRLFC
jgi:hypothetical protein